MKFKTVGLRDPESRIVNRDRRLGGRGVRGVFKRCSIQIDKRNKF